MDEKSQNEAASKREIRIKRLHFGNNKGIMSEELAVMKATIRKLIQRAGGRCEPVQ